MTKDDAQQPSETSGTVVDPDAMRALAHPVRWALIELLSVEGTATATRCAELTGEPHATCSFHLRQLARFGFIEEAPSDSKRERPWRLVSRDQSWSSQPTGDLSRDLAVRQLDTVYIDRETERIRGWARTADIPDEWRGASGTNGVTTWMTPAELRQMHRELMDLMQRFVERIDEPATRPADARPVRLFSATFPLLNYVSKDPAGPDDGAGRQAGPADDAVDEQS